MKYEFTPEMGEISGFGGGYEETCRAMLKAGLKWWDAHPDADPKFHGYSNVYGVVMEDNKDARALSKAVVKAAKNDCTGAMHQAVISAVFFIHKNGWEKYVAEMSKEKRRGSESDC